MNLETFFEKFDQFADAPDGVAKMRERGKLAAPSGLCSFFNVIPRALPWAGMSRAFGAPIPCPKGAFHPSLGQRPRITARHSSPALKGRPKA